MRVYLLNLPQKFENAKRDWRLFCLSVQNERETLVYKVGVAILTIEPTRKCLNCEVETQRDLENFLGFVTP